MTSADNEPLVFSVLLNQYLSGSPKDIEDKIAIRLAQFSRTAPADVTNVQLRKAPAGRPRARVLLARSPRSADRPMTGR